jgi:hypothetical protein
MCLCPRSERRSRTWLKSLLLLGYAALAGEAFAQPCLIQGDPGPISLVTDSATVQPQLTAVEPAQRIRVVLFPQAIPQGERRRTVVELTSLYRAASKAAPPTATIFNGTAFSDLPRATTLAAWQRGIQDALAVDPVLTQPVSPVDWFAAFADSAGSLGGNWSSVLLVGRPPEVDPQLQDYTLSWLRARFCAQHLRVNVWTPDGVRPEFWAILATATAGASGLESLADLPPWLALGPFVEAVWPLPSVTQGFVFERGTLGRQSIPIIRAAAGATLPAPRRYAELRTAAREAADLLRNSNLNTGQAQRIRELLNSALVINPADAEALQTGADFYARFKDFQTAGRLLGSLEQVKPRDANVSGRSGHYLFLAGDLDHAE